MKKITFLTFLCCLLTIPLAMAQTTFSSSGGYGTSILNGPAGSASIADVNVSQSRAPVVITHSVTQTIDAGASVICQYGANVPAENEFYREFDLSGFFGISGVFNVSAVEFALENVTGPYSITVNVYSSTSVFPGGWPASYVLQGTNTVIVDAPNSLSIVSVPVVASIPAGERLLYEVVFPDTGGVGPTVEIGMNDDGQTDVSWIMAPACGIGSPTDYAAIGFPNSHLIMNVVGEESSGPDTIYFSSAGTSEIWTAPIDGSGPTTLLYTSPSSNAVGIELDETAGLMYWGGGNTSDVFVAPIIGGGPITTMANGSDGSERHDMALDPANNRYFYTGDQDGFYVANLDGTGVATQIIPGGSSGDGIAAIEYDAVNDKVYYVDQGNAGVARVNPDGTVYELLYTFGGFPRGIALDVPNDKLYITDRSGGNIVSGNLDGTAPLDILYSDASTSSLYHIDIDRVNNEIYWVNFGSPDEIYMAAADGTGTPTVVYSGSFGSIRGIALGGANAVVGDPPVIACPADIMIDTSAGQCTGVANWADPVAIDTEDGPLPTTQTMGPASGSAFPTGDTIIEYSVTDSDGNTSTCQFTVTVTDNEAPVALCQDLTVELDVNGMFTITPNDIDNGSSDNCGIVTYAFGGAPGAPGSLATIMGSNNGGADGGAVFFDMTIGPNDINVTGFDMNIQDAGAFTMDLYALVGTYVGNETNPAAWGAPVESGSGTSNGTDIASIATLGAPVTMTANTTYGIALVLDATHSHRYTNGDGTNEAFSNADLSLALGAGQNTPFSSGPFSPRIFNGSVNYETGAVPPFGGTFTCADVGANTIILEVTDAEGNTTTCTSTVTVEDNIAPDIVCNGQPNNVNELQDFEGTTIPGGWTSIIDAGVQDWTFGSGDLPTGDDFPTFAAIFDDDAAGPGNTNAGSLVSPVYDLSGATGTTVMLGYEVAFQEAGDQEFSVEVYDGAIWNQIAFYDADLDPDIQTEAFDVSAFANAAFQVRFVYDDLGGWGWHAAIDNFTLQYDVPATPYDVILDANGNATVNAADLLLGVNEACGWTATVGGAPAPSTLFTTLAGGNGNFGNMFDMNALGDVTIDSFDIHGDVGAVFDVEVYAKAGTYVGFETDAAAWTLIGTAPGVVSNGDGVVTPLNLALNYAMAAGETHAFYVTPTDFSTGGFNYTNGTTVGAVFAADANLEFLEGAGSGYPFNGTLFSPRVFNGNIQYSAGGGPSTTLDVDCSNLGENLIEVTVTDASGNVAMCTATVNVIDDTDPILVCWDTTIELGADGTAVVDPMALLAVLPSSYNVMTISSDNQSGAPGETDLTVPVTDAASITFDWDYSTPDGPGFDSFGYLLNGVYTELTDPAGATNQNGSAGPIAVVAGDVFGFRSASVDGLFGPCTTVVSNFMPGFTGQFDPANWTETLNNSDGSAMFVELPGGPLSFDACGITILAVDVTEVTCADIGTPVVITVFASDASGNIAACTSTVTVVDLLAPVVTCPADITVDPGVGNLFYEVPDYFGTGEATALDNCTDPLTLLSQDPAAGTLLPDGVYTVTMTAEDEYGNIGTCTFELTVESVLGLDDNELDIAISMYPNPAETQVTITNSSNIQLEKAAIYDMNGKLIQQVDLSLMTGEKVIDVSYLSAGVYIVQITSDESSAIKRLIKE